MKGTFCHVIEYVRTVIRVSGNSKAKICGVFRGMCENFLQQKFWLSGMFRIQ